MKEDETSTSAGGELRQFRLGGSPISFQDKSLRRIAGVASGRMLRIRPRRGKNTKGVLEKNDYMTPGSKGHAFHACMKMHDFGTRKT